MTTLGLLVYFGTVERSSVIPVFSIFIVWYVFLAPHERTSLTVTAQLVELFFRRCAEHKDIAVDRLVPISKMFT